MKFVTKFIVALIGWDPVLKLLLQFAVKYLSGLIGEWRLSRKHKMLIQLIDVLNRTLGNIWAKETPKDIDDELIKRVAELCELIAEAHSFKLHQVSEI